MQKLTLDIDEIDKDQYKNDEEFYRIMAGSINRLGQWALELHQNADKILGE